MNEHLKRLGDDLLASVKGYVKRSLEAFDGRLKTLESRPPVPGPAGLTGEKGEPGSAGLKGDPGEPGAVGEKGDKGDKGDPGERGERGLPGEKGERGVDGKSIDPDAWLASVKHLASQLPKGADLVLPPPVDTQALGEDVLARVMRALDALPPPKDGAPGQKGDPGLTGERGLPGENGEKGDKGDPGSPGERGEKGDKGDPGAPGLPGEKGEPGAKGEPGEPGVAGRAGDKGQDGAHGERGEKGEQGLPGLDGRPGEPGERGDKGDPGVAGERGEKGDAGERGEKGDPGLTGERGEAGARGEKGDPGGRGEKGDPGLVGERGERGEKGDPGLVGERGEAGQRGEKGEPGERGDKGDPGIAGKDGAPGLNGQDADPEVMRAQIAEALPPLVDQARTALHDHIDRRLEALPVPQNGERGAPGADGKSIDPEEVRAEIARLVALLPPAVNGKDGQDGQDGRDGRDGDHGRDATAINILDGLDPAKKYQRNTHATFRGGMVCAFRVTDPLGTAADPEGREANLEKCGWQVTLNGEADFDVTLGDDQRTLSIRRTTTKGQILERQVRIPTTIYRGVWKEGEAYGQGDSTTRDGGSWVLMTAQQKGRPGDDGSGWQLAVKKGTAGRDGLKGEKGERGAEGRPGRDLTQLGFDGKRT